MTDKQKVLEKHPQAYFKRASVSFYGNYGMGYIVSPQGVLGECKKGEPASKAWAAAWAKIK